SALILAEEAQSRAAANHPIFSDAVGETDARLRMGEVAVESLARFTAGSGVQQTAFQREAFHFVGDRAGLIEIESTHHAVVALRHGRFVIVSEAQVQGKARADFPIVLNETGVVITSVEGI